MSVLDHACLSCTLPYCALIERFIRDGPYGVLSLQSFFDRNPGNREIFQFNSQRSACRSPCLASRGSSTGLSSPLLTDKEKERSHLPQEVKRPDVPWRNIGFQAEVGLCVPSPFSLVGV